MSVFLILKTIEKLTFAFFSRLRNRRIRMSLGGQRFAGINSHAHTWPGHGRVLDQAWLEDGLLGKGGDPLRVMVRASSEVNGSARYAVE